MNRHYVVAVAVVGALFQASCKHKAPAGVVAEVNGHNITAAELNKIYQSQFPEPIEESNGDQVTAQRLDLLGKMITGEIMWQQAEKLGLTATDNDVDTEITKSRAPFTKDEFDKQLEQRHLTLQDLRTQMRRDLTITKLVNREITSHIIITDADVAEFYNANKAVFNSAEPTIHLAQILVTPNPDANVRNLKNSKAQNATEAKNKIQDILRRLQQGEEFGMVASSYSEDPSATNGGDLGYIQISQLDKLSPEVNKVIESIQPGSISGIMQMGDGFRILKVFEREPAGQRELTDPRVQQKIRDTLTNRKEQVLNAAFYEVAHNSAKIVNYLAQDVIENARKK